MGAGFGPEKKTLDGVFTRLQVAAAEKVHPACHAYPAALAGP